jgi:hypothetical protein
MLSLTLEAVPQGATWRRDTLGPKRTPLDPSLLPLTADAATKRILKERKATFADVMPYDHGTLPSPRGTASIPLVVGREETLFLDAGNDRRVLTIRADSARSLVLTRTWTHLRREGEADPPEEGR